MSELVSELDCIQLQTAATVDACVIWLHGLGADGSDFVPVAEQLQAPPLPGIRLLFPDVPLRPISINQGYAMRGWYDVKSMDIVSAEDTAGIIESSNAITALIDQQLALGIAAKRIVLAGFSQGGVIALHCALYRAHAIGGVIALSCYLPQCTEFNAPRSLPLFIAHGSGDDVVALSHGRQALARCRGQGYAPEWHTYDMAHSVCLDEIRDLRQWLLGVLAI